MGIFKVLIALLVSRSHIDLGQVDIASPSSCMYLHGLKYFNRMTKELMV